LSPGSITPILVGFAAQMIAPYSDRARVALYFPQAEKKLPRNCGKYITGKEALPWWRQNNGPLQTENYVVNVLNESAI
jgi:hypothetical protein